MNKVNEAYENAGQARTILDLEHAIETKVVRTIGDIRVWLNERGDRINKELTGQGFIGWENGEPKFSPELDYTRAARD